MATPDTNICLYIIFTVLGARLAIFVVTNNSLCSICVPINSDGWKNV